MHGNSRIVTSPQDGVHAELASRVRRHLTRPWQRPLQAHGRAAFAAVVDAVRAHAGALILDAGCGTGDSTAELARRHPDALVVGVDKSADRLRRGGERVAAAAGAGQPLLVRADLLDFWRLALAADWRPRRQFILYPNPWPKAAHLGRRWHGHPVFPTIVALGGELELRTNWQLYADEFAAALACVGIEARVEAFDVAPDGMPLTPFEAKYLASGQRCWRLRADLDGARPGGAPGDLRQGLVGAMPAV
ncbi:MAG TPA: methyltransferase domain-containing protein [Pseudomonadales bacterium]|nr:methyltransferase domain-containing protein [Pseudomonadales bacterium]